MYANVLFVFAQETTMKHVVLVTGGSGFLGQHVVKHLQLYGENVKDIRVLDVVDYKQKLGIYIY